jgi:hypothetical protein
MNSNHLRPVESLQQILKHKEILKAVLGFQTVKQVISSIVCMAINEECKVHLFEVVHCHQPRSQLQDHVVFILTQAIIKYDV